MVIRTDKASQAIVTKASQGIIMASNGRSHRARTVHTALLVALLAAL